jgi:TonB family protein
MKWLGVMLVVAGCSRDSLKADVEMFCNAPTEPTPTLNELGPYVAEHARTDELRQLIARLPGGKMTLMDFASEFQKLMNRTGIERCKMLDALLHKRVRREEGEEGDDTSDVTDADAAPLPLPSPPLQSVPPMPPSPLPPTVAPMQLEGLRISGDKNIVPDDLTKVEISRSGKGKIVTSYKLCLSTAGSISSVSVLKSSGFPAYDAKIQREMRTWRYRPYVVDGKASPVCTAVTYIYSQR